MNLMNNKWNQIHHNINVCSTKFHCRARLWTGLLAKQIVAIGKHTRIIKEISINK